MDTELLYEWETVYTKKGKHRKKCAVCNRLIQDGETVNGAKIKVSEYYPVKGKMSFVRYKFKHIDCEVKV